MFSLLKEQWDGELGGELLNLNTEVSTFLALSISMHLDFNFLIDLTKWPEISGSLVSSFRTDFPF